MGVVAHAKDESIDSIIPVPMGQSAHGPAGPAAPAGRMYQQLLPVPVSTPPLQSP
jgi:hypothetical protein